jgi:hypothetical protein
LPLFFAEGKKEKKAKKKRKQKRKESKKEMETIDIFKKEIDMHFKIIIAGIILIVIILVWKREKFIDMIRSHANANLPFTSGASLRVMSEDSSSNRGFNNTWSL